MYHESIDDQNMLGIIEGASDTLDERLSNLHAGEGLSVGVAVTRLRDQHRKIYRG